MRKITGIFSRPQDGWFRSDETGHGNVIQFTRGDRAVTQFQRAPLHFIRGGQLGQLGFKVGVGALIALPMLLAIGWVFSLVFPVSFYVSIAVALAVSGLIALLVLGATWVPSRRAIAIAPRDALWHE